MATQIKGIIAATVTSMNEDESLNEAEIRHQVNRQIAAGVDAVFCLGTNGEFYIQSEEEKLQVMRIVVDEVKGRVPVYAGTGCPGTKATIALSLKAKEIGVDSLGYLSVEDIRKIAVGCGLDFCVGCFTGEYPAPAPEPQPADKFAEKYEE